jgi:bifunctional UDP-N-acetylglucosamine pyrophosphorylase/glucosamine-1-phosphate N-acetyltransferase
MQKPIAGLSDKTRILMEKGVMIYNPLSVEIGSEVEVERISGNGVTLYPGTRLFGEKTLISEGVTLGYESQVTVDNCQIGPHVELKGGFFTSSVFLANASMASGAHVREGCLLEEESSAAHTVGLKQTVLFPFVTLGSLINFCDCFMAGGTSRKNHSEVGSSYIHFNYTPNQDKATPSLIGDVPRGVMLNQPPVFLGGQGGLVGPVRLGYGTVIPAGTVYRKDCPEGGKLLYGKNNSGIDGVFYNGLYREINRRVYNNLSYLANLLALRQWYLHVRQPFFQIQKMGNDLYLGAMDVIENMIQERLKRFHDLSEKMEKSIETGKKVLDGNRVEPLLNQQREFHQNFSAVEKCFTMGSETQIEQKNRDDFVQIIHRTIDQKNNSYLAVIKELEKSEATAGTQWLQGMVDHIINAAMKHLPSFRRI